MTTVLRVYVMVLVVASRVVRKVDTAAAVVPRRLVVLRLRRLEIVLRLSVCLLVMLRRIMVFDGMNRLMVVLGWNDLIVLVVVVMRMVFVQNLVVLVVGVVLQHQSVAVMFLGFRMHLLWV